MKITEVKVFPIHEEKLKAFVSVVFDSCFMVNDIKVICGRDGLFISMPSRKKKNGEFKDVAHPLNNETRKMLEGEILAEYERVLEERGEEMPAARPRRLDDRTRRPEGTESRSQRSEPKGTEPPTSAPAPAEAPFAPLNEEKPPVAAAVATGTEKDQGSIAEEKAAEDQSLEEVEARHLRDSFWSVS